MAASPSVDRQTFLTYLRQSGLVTEAQLSQLEQQHADIARGRALARVLVEKGVLTRFQAERLLMGRTAGFLLGPYRILEQIGRGGMGRVYKAQHRTMRRMVALKVLSPDLLKTERAVQLFLHEVRAAAQLHHPNIVTAYDANEINGRYYLVLEYVDGPNLEQLVRDEGPLSVGLACDYIRQAAQGLQCAHLAGMVHRDIKPANIMVQWQLNNSAAPGLVKISDFGLARLGVPSSSHGSNPTPTILTQENTVMGTPDYLSPEQSRCLHRTDIRSDIYSLGCTFYYLLTGQVPFPGGTALDKLIRHGTDTPRPISEFRSDVPAAVLATIDRMMAKHPDERFRTPAEVADALKPYAVSGPAPGVSQRSPAELPIELPPSPAPDDAIADVVMDGSNDELTALTVTLSVESSPTRRLVGSSRTLQQDRLKLAVLCAVVFVGALFALALLVALLLM